MSTSEDDEIEVFLAQLMDRYARPMLQAMVIAAVSLFSIAVFTGSPAKAVTVALFVLAMAMFSTWRRYLQPISFIVFCAAVLAWTDVDILDRVRGAITMVRLSLAS